MNHEPQNLHPWLQKLVGDWTYEIEGACEPGKPPQKATGTENVRFFGGIWVLCESRGEMPGGGRATALMTLGHDSQKERFVGTWLGSMMSWLFVYEGSLDVAGQVLSLNTAGPDFAVQGKSAKYRDVIEFKSSEHRVMNSYVLGEDGDWHRIMSANFWRQI
ncbi:uncharacterized protein sS8_4359 [Methylocaldum marinum]|uniref:DUF1579 domain-containing protein n=1 Tax=Methylocaldum marinum TaxID=1432792 RepID=A0A250L1V2_9GAMM|nr:DUF1579 domain-containing protein [Methylocaldum marinum]BBA36289.1 uncharacterized protein sS8_4359 [Methylocaldum marinum]